MKYEDMLWKSTVTFNSYENDVAERVNQILMKMMWLMLADSDLLLEVWSELLNTAVYLRLWISNKHFKDKTFYEVLTNKKLNLSNLWTVECLT